MKSSDIRDRFLKFFESKAHKVIPSASTVPENDPTTLFTTAGMQPLVPYLLGEKHPLGMRLTSSQKCIRTGDIDEVGDSTHLTFFEMLGNWSLGDYFKQESISWSFEFLTDLKVGLGLNPQNLYVTIFVGDENAPRDLDSLHIWQNVFGLVGIEGTEGDRFVGAESGRIFAYGADKNWWGPVGNSGPCGPDTEIFFDTGREHKTEFGAVCHPNCDCGRFVEIWNNVFMEYVKKDNGRYVLADQKNVDTGMGLERIVAIVNRVDNVYETDLFAKIIKTIEQITDTTYEAHIKEYRIIADHIKAAVFLLADGVVPSNTDRGYVLRKLIRRALLKKHDLDPQNNPGFCEDIAYKVWDTYQEDYPELQSKEILSSLRLEQERFEKTLDKGQSILNKKITQNAKITGADAFELYDTYGFPLEITKELIRNASMDIDSNFDDDFENSMEEQKMRSRTATQGQFKGGLADHSEISTWYHTLTHLTYAGLRKVLGEHVLQRGSNITPERLRFDFSHQEKVTREQLDEVERFVNDAIAANLNVSVEEMDIQDAFKSGAIGEFGHKYPQVVKVYIFKDSNGQEWSREICGGPHVDSTDKIEGTYKITKEESVAAGVRRIKGTVA